MHPLALTSLADHLRSMSDEGLSDLLERRADLAVPAPRDFRDLAARSLNGYSLARALRLLTLFQARLLESALVLGEIEAEELALHWGPEVSAEDIEGGLASLEALALAWRSPSVDGGTTVLVAAGLDRVLVRPLGLGEPLVELLARMDPGRLRTVARSTGQEGGWPAAQSLAEHLSAELPTLLAAAPTEARDVLDTVVSGGGFGSVPNAQDAALEPDSPNPVMWLMSRGLLVATAPDLVEVPREVARALRARLVSPVGAHPPELAGQGADVHPSLVRAGSQHELVDAAGAGEVSDLLRHTSDLLDGWTANPPRTLRSGGLGVRELKRTAKALALSETAVVELVATVHAAGLLAAAEIDDDAAVLLPTEAYDEWLEADDADRWSTLVQAWLEMSRWPALAVASDASSRAGARTVAVLSGDDVRSDAADLRRLSLRTLADAAAGAAPAASDLAVVVSWHRPFAEDVPATTAAVLEEAALLGVLGRGALTSYAKALLNGDSEGVRRRLTALLPPPVSEVLVQADHTVIAPGRLRVDLARAFALVADRESAGAGTVYRITEGTVRRALDAGMSAADIKGLLADSSRTPVPQSLEYLVDDCARRYGRLRLGSAGTYIRSDDESHLAEILSDRRLRALHLRRVGPGVLVTDSPIGHTLGVLRDAGQAPVAEAPDGSPVMPDAVHPRARPLRDRPTAMATRVPQQGTSHAVVARLRAADRMSRRPAGTPVDAASMADVLRRAAAERHAVLMAYVDSKGVVTNRVIDPLVVSGRLLDAFDHLRGERRTFNLDRILSLSNLEASGQPTSMPRTESEEGSL